MNSANWPFLVASLGFAAVSGVLAFHIQPFGFTPLASTALGLLAAILGCGLAILALRINIRFIIFGSIALAAGLTLGLLLDFVSNYTPVLPSQTSGFARVFAPVLLGYIGLIVGLAKAASTGSAQAAARSSLSLYPKVLDTSVLIDGRITEVVEAGFVDGTLVIPRFVLNELQVVADSQDSARRARGRRGLDVVKRLQSIPDLHIEVSLQDFPAIREVDLKLIEFAKTQRAKIVTNDFNLNKLAQVQGIQVLNVNELANSLKPVVLPGEIMKVFILKEGKEHNQGIAYLDDGTMVVVDNARRMMSKHIEVVVTSVLQTTAGKMIFGRYDERVHAETRPYTASTSHQH